MFRKEIRYRRRREIFTDLKKKRLDRAPTVEERSQKIAAAAILLGPKKLRILVRSRCKITRHGLSNASVGFLSYLEVCIPHAFDLWFIVLLLITKWGPTNMAPMAS